MTCNPLLEKLSNAELWARYFEVWEDWKAANAKLNFDDRDGATMIIEKLHELNEESASISAEMDRRGDDFYD